MHPNSKNLVAPGKLVSIIDLLTEERYTNWKLLNDVRNSGYKSPFYEENKRFLSAACFSSAQDDLTIDRSDKNHLFHTEYISFDIDIGANPYLLTDSEGIKEHLIDRIPHIAYIGKSISNIGLWGLIPILDKNAHYDHYEAMKMLFKAHDVEIDKTSDISRLRFLAYDPDGYINHDAKVFTETIHLEKTVNNTIDEYERTATDSFFIAACRWVEAKYEIKFQKGCIHNYLLYLYSTLRGCHVSRDAALNWIYNNLIEESQVTTNCLDEPKWIK